MESNILEKILTISVLSLWFLFPMGILISFIYQDKHQKYPKFTNGRKAHQPSSTEEGEELKLGDDYEDYDEFQTPKIKPHEIPIKEHDSKHLT